MWRQQVGVEIDDPILRKLGVLEPDFRWFGESNAAESGDDKRSVQNSVKEGLSWSSRYNKEENIFQAQNLK